MCLVELAENGPQWLQRAGVNGINRSLTSKLSTAHEMQ